MRGLRLGRRRSGRLSRGRLGCRFRRCRGRRGGLRRRHRRTGVFTAATAASLRISRRRPCLRRSRARPGAARLGLGGRARYAVGGRRVALPAFGSSSTGATRGLSGLGWRCRLGSGAPRAFRLLTAVRGCALTGRLAVLGQQVDDSGAAGAVIAEGTSPPAARRGLLGAVGRLPVLIGAGTLVPITAMAGVLRHPCSLPPRSRWCRVWRGRQRSKPPAARSRNTAEIVRLIA